jgi:hypothetical protein
MLKASCAIVACLLVLRSACVAQAQRIEQPLEVAPAQEQQAESQKWEFGIAVRAGGGPCSGIVGTFPVPGEWPEQDVKVASESITPTVRHRYRTLDGLRQVVFDVTHVPAGGEAECFITYEIVKRPQKPPLDTAALGIPKDPPREVKKYLNPSPLIESTSSKVRSLARELPEGKESAWEQVQAILAGVRERVKFERDIQDKFKGVLGALRDGQADREDMTATFVAICRAAKIPARMVWAMDYCYSEFYLEELPAADATAAGDATATTKRNSKAAPPKGAWYPCVVHEETELGACNDPRPVLEKGDAFKVPEEKPLQRFVKEFLTMKGAVQPTVEFRRRQAD